jgi:hypothetical protein
MRGLRQALCAPDLAMGSFKMLAGAWFGKSELALLWAVCRVGGARRVAAGEDGV